MIKFSLIFLSDKVLLSKKEYEDWREIQDCFFNYKASVDFETLEEVKEYIMIDYKVSEDKALQEIYKLIKSLKIEVEILTDI
ncbi:hypothetical protein [Labilibacter marinus]|uniref:hypothetical protein n=1 Tax=Labilibacter marinus TaxID=1477105 RepID=UPI0008352BE7|nr:hypothetical protein [Labilibacter marinus]